MGERTVPPLPRETEAKLLVPHEAVLTAIAGLERLGRYRLRTRRTAWLHSVYLDTAELTLARHRIALRLRRRGRRWEATAKWSGQVRGVIHQRPEITVPLSAGPRTPFSLPAELRQHLGPLVGRRQLGPILITRIQRCLFDVVPLNPPATNAVIAELALDRVRLVNPDRPRRAVATYCEIEIEVRQGTRRDITALAVQLQKRFGLKPSRESKFSRGLALLYE